MLFFFLIEKKSGRFEEKSEKTQSSKLKQNYICFYFCVVSRSVQQM
jgi:hypothetical protein